MLFFGFLSGSGVRQWTSTFWPAPHPFARVQQGIIPQIKGDIQAFHLSAKNSNSCYRFYWYKSQPSSLLNRPSYLHIFCSYPRVIHLMLSGSLCGNVMENETRWGRQQLLRFESMRRHSILLRRLTDRPSAWGLFVCISSIFWRLLGRSVELVNPDQMGGRRQRWSPLHLLHLHRRK